MSLHLIVGPPAAGKSSWVKAKALPDDITIDYDALAAALSPNGGSHDPPAHVKAVTKAARQAAITAAISMSTTCDVYVIHSTPSPTRINWYRQRGATIICLDPGRDVVLERIKRERPWQMAQAAAKWYEMQANGLVPAASKLTDNDCSREW